jgi:hypothetical protein
VRPKAPAEQASAMAFIVFRVAQNLLKRMRGADFDIDAGPPYFAFLREVLVFLVAVTDRLAHARLPAAARQEFTVALVRHLARNLQENEDHLLGPPPRARPATPTPSSTWSTRSRSTMPSSAPTPKPPVQASSPTSPSCATWAAAWNPPAREGPPLGRGAGDGGRGARGGGRGAALDERPVARPGAAARAGDLR